VLHTLYRIYRKSITGGQNINTVNTENGITAIFKKGILLPFGDLCLSDKVAIQGSVIASNALPAIVIRPIIVKIPKILPWGIKYGISADSGGE
jgi:hypothetical protein